MNYKGFLIESQIVCFTIRYFVYGNGFISCTSYESIEEAEQAIDKYLARTYIDQKLTDIAKEINVDKNIIIETLANMLIERI